MKRNLHKSSILKLALTLLILFSCWSVYAGNPNTNNGREVNVKVVKCYPNPATSVINFEFSTDADKSGSLKIFSFTGKKMTDVAISSGKITILLDNDYYRGIYIYQVHDKNGRILETGKFQVVK
jgi:hypothetical protein